MPLVANVCPTAPCHPSIAAALATGEDEIVVAAGTYVEPPLVVDGGRRVTVTGLGEVTLAAAPGPEPLFSVSGGSALTLVNVSASKLGARILEVADSRLVARDSAFYAIGPAGGGAVAWITRSSALLTGCTLADSATSGDGGHLLVSDSDLTVRDTLFRGGVARRGGALYLQATQGAWPADLTGVRFEDNLASGIGGAVATEGDIQLEVAESTFEGGVAAEGGAIGTVTGDATVGLGTTDLIGNRADQGSALSVSGLLTLLGVRVEGNTSASGHTIDARGQTVVTSSVFCGNRTGGSGAAVARLGPETHTWSHNRLWLNVGGRYGGLVVDDSGILTLDHSFVLGNSGTHAAALLVQPGAEVSSWANAYAYSQGPLAQDLGRSLFRTDLFFANGDSPTASPAYDARFGDPRFVGFSLDRSCGAVVDRYPLDSPLVDADDSEIDRFDGTAADIGPYGGKQADDDPAWEDADRDSVPALYDCDDTSREFRPQRPGEPPTEIYYDGEDQDCAGGSDYDADGDGYEADRADHPVPIRLADCDDEDPTVNPAGRDAPKVDGNCDGEIDGDRDGFPESDDCRDDDPEIHPGAVEDGDLARDSNCDDVYEPEGALVPAGCAVVGAAHLGGAGFPRSGARGGSAGDRPAAAGAAPSGAGPRGVAGLELGAALAAWVATRRRARGGSCRA